MPMLGSSENRPPQAQLQRQNSSSMEPSERGSSSSSNQNKKPSAASFRSIFNHARHSSPSNNLTPNPQGTATSPAVVSPITPHTRGPVWSSSTAQKIAVSKSQTVESLREAFNHHLMQTQLRTRKKSKLSKQVSSPTISPGTLNDASPGSRRASQLSNQTGDTQQLQQAQQSLTNTTTSVETQSSAVTPSYPFPNMSHRSSFSAMSPTGIGPHDKTMPSGTVTPASVAFHPPGTDPATPFENPDYPSPNLYELALLLHSEPGIDAFWNNVVWIMREFYQAERISLAVPTDLTDLENTPWGQKASFNVDEDDAEDMSLTYIGDSNQRGIATPNIQIDDVLDPHSKIDVETVPGMAKARSPGDGLEEIALDSTSHGPFSPITIGIGDITAPDTSGSEWVSDNSALSPLEAPQQPASLPPEISLAMFAEGEASRSKGRVFPTLQPLSYEAEALLDDAGVIRVLERGKTVVLSREYRDIRTKWERLAAEKEERAKLKRRNSWASSPNRPDGPDDSEIASSIISAASNAKAQLRRSKSHGKKQFPFAGADDVNDIKQKPGSGTSSPPSKSYSYEEFEQAVTSPWSQSPAPSPAIRPDPNENPFFASPKVDEESFNPSTSSPKYSASELVHAIGLESASTVVHIPLVHPSQCLSRIGQTRKMSTTESASLTERRAPIAILSILSPVIPFPSNLVHSLSHLAPMVATAYSLAQAHTLTLNQLAHLQYQAQKAMPEGLTQAAAAAAGLVPSVVSITSPSDYSRSTPGNSNATTPNIDPASLGSPPKEAQEAVSKSPLGSPRPTGTGSMDSYFSSRQRKMDSKRRQGGSVYLVGNIPEEHMMGSTLSRPGGRYRPSSPLSSEGGVTPTGKPNEVSSVSKHLEKQRSISEVMTPDGKNSQKKVTILSEGSEDVDTPRPIPETRKQHRSTSESASDRMKLDLGSMDRTKAEFSDFHPLGTPSGVPLPPTVPSTPCYVPLPPTPAEPPAFLSKSMQRNHTTDVLPTVLESQVTLQDLPGTSSLIDGINSMFLNESTDAASQVSGERTPTSAPNSNAVTYTRAAKTGPKRKKLVRRHSSGHIGQHTKLHSYGADFEASIPTLTSTSVSRSERQRSRGGDPSSQTLPYDVSSAQPSMPPPSSKLLRTIIGVIPVHVFTAAPQTGEITWVNSRMLSYRGATVEEFIKDPYEPMHPEDRDNYVRLWMAAVRKGEPFSYQIRIRRFDGLYRWFMVRAVPLRDSRGLIVHWFGTNMDIHDQRLAEVDAARQAEMAESESKYRSLANSSPQIVFAATANMGITFANNQWLSYSGQTQDEALHLGFMEAVHPADRSKCSLPGFMADQIKIRSQSKIQASWFTPAPGENSPSAAHPGAAGSKSRKSSSSELDKRPKNYSADTPFSTEVRLKDRNGEYRWHLVRCVPVEANVEGLWFGTCTDINDHKLLEQKLKEANEAAQKSMESKTRFLSNMSHEIRTPLIGISGMVNFLLDTPLNGEQLDYCHTISSSSDGLLMVINDILDLSKVEAGMMRLSYEWFGIRSLIEDANELLSTMAISKELELNYLVEDDVPSVVSGDRIRLRQVLLNVVGNAIKFTSTGEVYSRCYVMKDDTLEKDEVMLGFECHDTGPGFDKKDEELMFKPFSQIDGSSTRAHGGSGLGLVISRQLVELHGGKMTCQSEKGKGSTFYFSAKFKLPPQDEASPSSATTEVARTEQSPSHQYDSSAGHTPPSIIVSEGPISASTDASSAGSEVISKIPSNGSVSIPSTAPDPSTMHFALPAQVQQRLKESSPSPTRSPSLSKKSSVDSQLGRALSPPLFSILVVSYHHYSRIAISHHIKMTLPRSVPSQITVAKDFKECRNIIAGNDPVVFSHIVINLIDHSEIISLISMIAKSVIHNQTTIVVLTTPMQRTAIIEGAAQQSTKLGPKVQFIYKPIKPSRLGIIFDPTKEREAHTDKYRHTAQQVVESQKAVFSEMEKEVGNKGHKVLLVEDNRVNQKVLLRFLGRVGLDVETASDGVECVDKVMRTEPGYYGLILCDLHMPRKDGFAACSEIRRWEREHKAKLTPIIALSANVMADVAERCATAGFSRYVSKPVDFKVLGDTIKQVLDPKYSEDHKLMEVPSLTAGTATI